MKIDFKYKRPGQLKYKETKKGKATQKRYYHSLAKKLANKKYREKNHEKKRAENTLDRAVWSGKIKRKECEFCRSKKSEAHHPDYSKPLEVIWLCHKHHMYLHKKILKLKEGEDL